MVVVNKILSLLEVSAERPHNLFCCTLSRLKDHRWAKRFSSKFFSGDYPWRHLRWSDRNRRRSIWRARSREPLRSSAKLFDVLRSLEGWKKWKYFKSLPSLKLSKHRGLGAWICLDSFNKDISTVKKLSTVWKVTSRQSTNSWQFQKQHLDKANDPKSRFLTMSPWRLLILTVWKATSQQSRISSSRSWLVSTIETTRLTW